MVEEFTYARASSNYATSDPRCRLVPWTEFKELRNWLVDRLWSHDEKVALGVVDEVVEMDDDAFRALVGEAHEALNELLQEL